MKRTAIVVSSVVMVLSVIGFVVTLILNAFVLDDYDAYGEVPIPGSADLRLPAGEVSISFHTQVIGSPSGGGLPVPPLQLNIAPPDGVEMSDPVESFGSTTTVNNDARRRVWVIQIPADGTYRVTADGQTGGFINPRLAFGHGSHLGYLVWVFVGTFVVSLLALIGALVWAVRARRPVPGVPFPSHVPTDQGIRLEQLKTLTALRDSGALTQSEYEHEKRRILGGG